MKVIPLGSKGVELVQTNIQEPEDKETLIKKYFCLYGMEERFGLNMIFKVTKDESNLPRKLIITYRLFHVIPMANIIELRWPQFKV